MAEIEKVLEVILKCFNTPSAKVQKIIDKLKELNINELTELKIAWEQTFGVSSSFVEDKSLAETVRRIGDESFEKYHPAKFQEKYMAEERAKEEFEKRNKEIEPVDTGMFEIIPELDRYTYQMHKTQKDCDKECLDKRLEGVTKLVDTCFGISNSYEALSKVIENNKNSIRLTDLIGLRFYVLGELVKRDLKTEAFEEVNKINLVLARKKLDNVEEMDYVKNELTKKWTDKITPYRKKQLEEMVLGVKKDVLSNVQT